MTLSVLRFCVLNKIAKNNVEVIVKRIFTLFCLASCLLGARLVHSQEIHDGQSLLTEMHDRYKDAWYDSVVFKEKAITLKPDGTTSTEVWDEALQMPGKLRINRGATSEGNGFVFADGMLTTFQKGKPTGPRPFVHMLLVLGFDIYHQDAKTTIEQVKTQGYDLSQIYEEKWDGEDVYVVGAAKGDLKSKQFWVEKKRLLFVKLIAPDEKDATKLHDTRFRDYRKLSTGWISARVEFYVNGVNTFNEDYFDIKANVKFDPSLFDPAKFNETSIGIETKK